MSKCILRTAILVAFSLLSASHLPASSTTSGQEHTVAGLDASFSSRPRLHAVVQEDGATLQNSVGITLLTAYDRNGSETVSITWLKDIRDLRSELHLRPSADFNEIASQYNIVNEPVFTRDDWADAVLPHAIKPVPGTMVCVFQSAADVIGDSSVYIYRIFMTDGQRIAIIEINRLGSAKDSRGYESNQAQGEACEIVRTWRWASNSGSSLTLPH